jgi:hypothetical protein
VDVNGDGFDEIAVIKQNTGGKQRLEIYHPPAGVDTETGLPVASDTTFGSTSNKNNNIAIAGVDVNGDGIDEIAVIKQNTSGKQRLEIYNLPLGVDGETGPPIASDTTFGSTSNKNNNIAIAGIRY